MTALAAGGAVLLLSGTAVVLWPRAYGTEATLVLDGGTRVDNPVVLAGRIEAALLEREQLAGAAMELPAELRSPDPIGRLRAGIRVQSRGALGFAVEFRGSDPQSVQRIANRLADRAVAIIPKLTASPDDAAPLKELAARSRAVSEFLGAHPEVTVEQGSDKASVSANGDSALELLRTEKRQIEQKLAAVGAVDNPYADPGEDPTLLNRRLVELKNTISKREAALREPRPASPPPASQELTNQWRALLADLAAAQTKAASPAAHPPVTAHVTSRASLPTSPLTPNRLVLSIVALLLSLAAAMVAYILPRKASLSPRAAQPRPRSDPPPAPGGAQRPRSDPPPAPGVAQRPRSDPPPALAAATRPRSDPAPAGRPGSDPGPAPIGSEPPGRMAPQRTVVLSGASPPATESAGEKRSHTTPGGLEAPSAAAAEALAATVVAAPKTRSSPPPTAPLFGSRPPPGAGSYSVSSSHPPPVGAATGATRTTVERLSPLQSAHPPIAPNNPVAAGVFDTRHPSPLPADVPQIMSKPPALDPEAERWAARFENPPPVVETEEAPRKRSGRWKTQAMGSMIPLEASVMRDERPPPSDGPVSVEDRRIVVQPAQQPLGQLARSSELVEHDVPSGWRPNVDPADPQVVTLRDAVLAQGLSRRLRIVVTGSAGNGRAQLASALSFALAQAGARVLLIEADFDNPQIHQALAIETPSGAGFSQQIIARLHGKNTKPWVVVRCSPNLQVLAEGRLRSPGLVASSGFERAVRELGEGHHVVVIHAPALDRGVELRAIDALTQVAIVTRAKEPAMIHFGDSPLSGFL